MAVTLLGSGVLAGHGPAVAAPAGFFIEGRQLYTIDLATGASAAVGTTGKDERFSSLAFAPDGTLFAVADSKVLGNPEAPQIEPAELYTIDTGTGAASLVGVLSKDNDNGLPLMLTALTFSEDGVALLSGLGPGSVETVFVVDIDGASGGLVPVSPLTEDSGFLTVATDTACDGTVFGVSIAIPVRDDTPTTATVGDLPPPGSIPGVGQLDGSDFATPAVGRTQQPTPAIPMVLTTIDPATGATTEVGELGLDMSLGNHPGLAVDRGDDTIWSVVLAGGVFTVDETSGAGDLPAPNSANEAGSPRQPQNLAISPVACSQPTTTTTSTTTTTTNTTVVTEDEPDPPPAPPATPVTAEPNFTG